MNQPANIEGFNSLSKGMLPGLLGIEVVDVEPGRLTARLDVGEQHHSPNGYLHAGTVVALADTACGYGCVASFPTGVGGFTTIELKANFLATASAGGIRCEAQLIHGGRTTQVWDARVTRENDGKAVAAFRYTQLLLRAQ